MQWNALILCAFITTVHTGTYSPDLCNGGTHSICQSLAAAVKCNVVDYCVDAVWANEWLPPDHTALCRACNRGINKIRTQSNRTAAAIPAGVEEMCQPLISPQLFARCTSAFNTRLKEMELILNTPQVTSTTVCTIAGLCHSDQQDLNESSGRETEFALLPGANRRRRQSERIPIKCETGAKFWCDTVENARMCGKTKYCKLKVWRKNCKPQDGNMKKC